MRPPFIYYCWWKRWFLQTGFAVLWNLSKPKTCLNHTDFTVPYTKSLCNLNLCKPNTCLNWTNCQVPKGFGLDRFYCITKYCHMKSSVTKSIFDCSLIYQYYISVVAKSSESHQNGYRSWLMCGRWWVWVKL